MLYENKKENPEIAASVSFPDLAARHGCEAEEEPDDLPAEAPEGGIFAVSEPEEP